MSDLSYESFKKQNVKASTKNTLSYEAFQAEKNKVPTGKKVTNFVKDVVKDTAMSFARVGTAFEDKVLKPIETKIVGKETVRPPSFIGGKEVTALGQGTTGKEKAKDIAGGLIEGLSNVAGGGAVKNVVQTGLKGKIKKAAVKGFKEGAATGFSNTFGKELQQQKSIKDATISGLKTAAITGPVGSILGGGAGLLGSKTSKVVDNLVDKPVDNFTSKADDAIVSSATNKGERVVLREAFDVADKLGFNMQKATQILDEAGTLSGKDGYYSVSDIEEIAKKYAPDKAPTVVKPTNAPTPIVKANGVTLPKIDATTGQPMKPSTKVATNSVDTTQSTQAPQTPSKFRPGTFEYYNETISNDFNIDPKKVEDIALGLRNDTAQGVPADAYLSFLKNKADETLDVDLIEKLKQSEVASFSGQKLQANQLAKEGNIVDVTKDIEKTLMKNKGINQKALDKEAKEIADRISEVFDSFKNEPSTRQALINTLEGIKCK